METHIQKADYVQTLWLETYETPQEKVPVVFLDELYPEEDGLDFTGNVSVVMQHPGRGTVSFTMSFEEGAWVTNEVYLGEDVVKWCNEMIIARKG